MSLPEIRAFVVKARGRSEAIEMARDLASQAGLRVGSSVWKVEQLEPHVRDNRKELLRWRVELPIRRAG